MGMHWCDVVILTFAAPVIFLPVVYVGWLFLWGVVYRAIRRAR
jgi:hypothetical protein